MTSRVLEGRRILLVEDEFFQAREIKALLQDAGAEVVGPTGRAEEVEPLLQEGRLDAALIDINLGGHANYEPAQLLQRHGVPFVFLTGYEAGAIPANLSAIPRLEKPASERRVIELLAQVL